MGNGMNKVTDPFLLAQLNGDVNIDPNMDISPEEMAKIREDYSKDFSAKLKPVTDQSILNQLNGVQDKSLASQPNADQSSYAENVLRGFAARGNQAMTALNPFATADDMKRIAAEQEWVKQHSGAGLGQAISDLAITAPAGGGLNPVTRSLFAGAIEGSTTPGGYKDKLESMYSGLLGAGVGEKAGEVLSYLAKPFTKVENARLDELAKKASDIGINLDAAQTTGLRTLYNARDSLQNFPSSSGAIEKHLADQRTAWQRALFEMGGESADAPTPDVMAAMKSRIGSAYNDVTSRNSLVVDPELKAALAKVRADYESGVIPTNQRSIVKKYLNDFDLPPEGAFIDGDVYQSIRSMLDKQAKAHDNNPATEKALKDIRSAIDSAMERSLTGPSNDLLPNARGAEDLAKWKKANHDWAIMKYIEKSIDPATETINPHTLMRTLTNREINRVIYGQGDQGLVDLAKVGKEYISPKVNNSDTSQKAMWNRWLSGAGLASGGASMYGLAQGQVAPAIATGGGLLASVLLPKAGASLLLKPDGYVAKGMLDLDKPTALGPTMRRIIQDAMRGEGLLFSNALTDDRNKGLLNYQ